MNKDTYSNVWKMCALLQEERDIPEHKFAEDSFKNHFCLQHLAPSGFISAKISKQLTNISLKVLIGQNYCNKNTSLTCNRVERTYYDEAVLISNDTKNPKTKTPTLPTICQSFFCYSFLRPYTF